MRRRKVPATMSPSRSALLGSQRSSFLAGSAGGKSPKWRDRSLSGRSATGVSRRGAVAGWGNLVAANVDGFWRPVSATKPESDVLPTAPLPNAIEEPARARGAPSRSFRCRIGPAARFLGRIRRSRPRAHLRVQPRSMAPATGMRPEHPNERAGGSVAAVGHLHHRLIFCIIHFVIKY
jgi:hypothetical protein